MVNLDLRFECGDNNLMRVSIVDSEPGVGSESREWEFERARMPLREVLEARVTREAQVWSRDPKRQMARAVEAFEKQRLVVIAGGRQVESLDEEIDLAAGVEFIKLTPLIGG